MSTELTDEQYRAIYAWIDAIPLSRPKRNMARDFSDGVLLAEVIAAYFPHLVEVHNYPAANSFKQKLYNLETLNTKVLKKLNYTIPKPLCEDVANCKPGAIEQVLNTLQYKMAKYREKKSSNANNDNYSVNNSPYTNENNFDENNTNNNNYIKQNHSSVTPTSVAVSSTSSKRPNPINNPVKNSVDQELLLEKEQQIRELMETIEIYELKITKLEQLVRLKDAKIQKLLNKNN